jgi:MraZ protein
MENPLASVEEGGTTSHVREDKWNKIQVRTTILYGEYELTIDEKNRLLIPAEVRRSLDPERDGNAFFIVIGVNKQPWFYPELGYEALVSKLASEMRPGESKLAFDQLNFSMAHKESWDKQGRLLIPEPVRRRTRLKGEVTLIGVRDHLELWDRKLWESRREKLFGQLKDPEEQINGESEAGSGSEPAAV